MYSLRAYKFGIIYGLTVFQEHFNHFLQIAVEFIQRPGLCMRAGESGDIADVEFGLRAAFHNSCVGLGLHCCRKAPPSSILLHIQIGVDEEELRRKRGVIFRFHHIMTPVTNSAGGTRPKIAHSAFTFQPAKLP